MRFSCSLLKARKLIGRIPVKYQLTGKSHLTYQLISTLLCTRNPYTYSYFEISICIYNVRGENDQMSTKTFKYSTCCAASVYIFVYIFIGASILLLSSYNFATESYACNISSQHIIAQQSCLRKVRALT